MQKKKILLYLRYSINEVFIGKSISQVYLLLKLMLG